MGRLMYSAIASLDGYVNDAAGSFEWAGPDEDVHRAANDLMRSVGSHLYGRRMYETMAYWDTGGREPDAPDYVREFAELWRRADKVVYSTTLAAPTTDRTRLERSFDPSAVRAMKASATDDLSISGPTLAGQAVRAGLVDVFDLFVVPIVIGGGRSWLPDGVRQPLELVDERRFSDGTVHLRYSAANR